MIQLLERPSITMEFSEIKNEKGQTILTPKEHTINPLDVRSDVSLKIGDAFEYSDTELTVTGIVESQITDDTYRIKVTTFGVA